MRYYFADDPDESVYGDGRLVIRIRSRLRKDENLLRILFIVIKLTINN